MNKNVYFPISFILCCIYSLIVDRLAVVLLFIPLWVFMLYTHYAFGKWFKELREYSKDTGYVSILVNSSVLSFVACAVGSIFSYLVNIPANVALEKTAIISFIIFIVSVAASVATKKLM